MRTILPAALLLAFAVGAAAQPPKAEPKVERITYRVIGLFARDREKDLRAGFADLAPDFKLVSVSFDEAEITVEFAPAKLWPGQKPERVTELVNDKVRGATHHTFGVKPRREIARDKLQEVTIPAAGCDCKGCNLAAYEAVANVEGVYRATASFKDGKVTVLFDPAKTDRAKLEDALRKKGVDLGKPGKK
jgi:copper chaperone CopZ